MTKLELTNMITEELENANNFCYVSGDVCGNLNEFNGTIDAYDITGDGILEIYYCSSCLSIAINSAKEVGRDDEGYCFVYPHGEIILNFY